MSKQINRNPALQTSFKLEFPLFPEINYFVTETELPGMQMGGVDTPYRNNATHMPSNRIEYDPLTVQMIVSEDYSNYERLKLWMHEIVHHEPVTEQLQNATLHILNSNKNVVVGVKFYGMYPTAISTLPLMSTVTDETPVMCTCTFRYQFHDFVRSKTPTL